MASTVSFSGVGSGIDFGTIRDAIIAQRSVPITQLQTKVSTYSSRINALKQLNTSLAALTTAAQALTDRDLGTGRSAAPTDANIATATATSAAALGSFDINVSRIATTLSQASRSYSSTTAPVLAGDATSATFELRTGGTVPGVEITIDSTNNSLAGLRDAINAKNAGVTANIVDVSGDGTNQQLILSSKATGANGRVELVETSSTGTGADLNLRSLNPPDGDSTKLDASLSINGLNITRSTNNISDAVGGVSLTLKKAGTTSINVTQSTDIDNKLRGFINAYNAVQDFVGGQYTKDSNNRPTGILAGDSTLRNVQQQLRDAITTISGNNGGSFNSLAQIGISVTDDGHLDLDSETLSNAVKDHQSDVRALLFGNTASQTGLFQNAYAVLNGLSDSVTGSVQTTITGYESSVKSMNDSITKKLASINDLKTSLTKQFSVVDAAIGELNSTQSSLTSIIKSLTSSSSS